MLACGKRLWSNVNNVKQEESVGQGTWSMGNGLYPGGIRFLVLGIWQLLENQGTFSVQTQLFVHSHMRLSHAPDALLLAMLFSYGLSINYPARDF